MQVGQAETQQHEAGRDLLAGHCAVRAHNRVGSPGKSQASRSPDTTLGMAAKQDVPPAYFAGTTADFQAAADVLLRSSDGVHLPAHSQLLASTSPVLSDMLKVAASQAPAGSKAVLPLGDFSESETCSILKARIHCQVACGQGCMQSGSMSCDGSLMGHT